ncbi:ycf45 [Symbiodinium sp. CCMP2456]|nr:ycf45 [Symbiodinium sp. CCMP2456]
MAHTGFVKRLFSDRRYGFIHSSPWDSDGSDVYFHFSELDYGEHVAEGTQVAFDLEEDPWSGRIKAVNVTQRQSRAWGSEERGQWPSGEPSHSGRASASAWERTPADGSAHEWNDGSSQGFATELRAWLCGLDHGNGEMLRFAEAISRHYDTWEALLEGSIQDADAQPVLLKEDFHYKIGLLETGHTVRMAAGLRDVLDKAPSKSREAHPETSFQPDSGREVQPQTEDCDTDSGPEDESNEGCILIFVCIMARGVELSLSMPRASTVGEVMAKLEELEGVEHGTQHLFSLSQARKLEPEEVVADGAQLFLSSPEDERMLSLLPEHIRPHLNPASLVDVVLDLDRKPVVHERDEQGKLYKRVLDACPLVQQDDLDAAEAHELLAGRWTKDNRSGISGTLHRVARIVDHYGGRSLTGLTLRMAHPMYGLAEKVPHLRRVIEDGKSLLVLGPPGCGKTTLLREVARSLSEEFNRRVFVVDTSSEICGFGRSAHVAVGRTTRRMQVADRSLQHQDMLEAVQNHTPEVLVIDEIGSQDEVEAACRIGFKGIALVATAHANNLKEAIDNVALQSLFGGFQTSTVSDQTAQRSADGRKFVEQRRSAPVFKSLVELGRGSGDEWVVYEDLEGAIDLILARKPAQGVRVPAPSTRGRIAKPTSGHRVGRESQEPTFRVFGAEETRGIFGSSFPERRGGRLEELMPLTPEAGAIAPDELEARRAMRDREISGRAYRLCFDGGVDGGDKGPGGAGAILRRLRAGTGHPDRRTGRTWMLYHPKSCPELMEYAGLLMGLRGVSQILHTLKPAPEAILIEGDCKLVVDRHSGGRAAQSLRSEHPDVEAKLDALANLVDEARQQLERQNVTLDVVRWRSRTRNKAADRLSHEAREKRLSTIELDSEVLALLRAFEVGQVPTLWEVREAHPMLRIAQGAVIHPRQLVGLVGLELKPDSADGSFSLSVRVDGAWGKADSFSLGLVPTGTIDFTRAQDFVAGEVGFWFSPKSGTVCGMLGGQKAEFTLPSLRGTHPRSASDKKKATLLNGARWGMTYRRGGLELFMAMPDDELQSLGRVQWPWGEVLPHRAYSAAVLFKPRRGGSGSVGWPSASQRQGLGPLPLRTCSSCSSDAYLTLLGDGLGTFLSNKASWTLQGFHPELDFLCRVPEGEALHLRCCRKCLSLHSRDMDTENFLRGLGDEDLAVWLRRRRQQVLATNDITVDRFFQRVSPGVEIIGRAILFPQTLFGCEWVQFPAETMRLAVRLKGQWTNRESFLLGITPEGCSFGDATIAEMGFFFSPHSLSLIGLDGTNFSWPGTLEEVWCQQLAEKCRASLPKFDGGLHLEYREDACWCIERTDTNELAIFYKPAYPVRGVEAHEWVQLGVVPWKTATLSQWRQWHFTIVFKAATSLRRGRVTKAGNLHEEKRECPNDYRGPFLGHECGNKSQGPRRGSERPRVEMLLEQDLTGDLFGGAPSVRKEANTFHYQWDGPQPLVQRLRAATRDSRPRRASVAEHGVRLNIGPRTMPNAEARNYIPHVAFPHVWESP